MKKIVQVLLLVNFLSPVWGAECDEYYFGIGVEKDFKKAFDCATKGEENNSTLLMLMYLNGDGTSVDINKAKIILDREVAGQRKNNWGPDATLSNFQTIIAEREKNPTAKYKKLDYGDIAMTTMDMNYYAGIQNRLQEQRAEMETNKVKKNLNPETSSALTEVEKKFEALRRSAGHRMSDSIDGTIRGLATEGYVSYLRDRHQKRIRDWMGKSESFKNDRGSLEKADKELNILYRKMQDDGKEQAEENSHGGTGDGSKKCEVCDDLKEEQRIWLKYREAWVRLLLIHLKPKKTEEKTLTNSIRARLTKERVEELKCDPLSGPGQ